MSAILRDLYPKAARFVDDLSLHIAALDGTLHKNRRLVAVRHFIALCFCCLLLAVPALSHAQDETATDPIVLPFAPPLDTRLFYRVLTEKKRPKGDSSLEFEQELTFKGHGEGCTLYLDNIAAVIDGNRINLTDSAIQSAIPIAIRPFMLSLELELDQSGEPIRVRDWSDFSAMLARLPDEVADRVETKEREDAKQFASEILSPYITATAEDAPWLLVKGWPSVLGYGGAEFENAVEYEADSSIGGGGILTDPIDATLTFTVTQTAEGNFRLVQTTNPDAEALAQAIKALLERIAATTAKGRASKQFEAGAFDGFGMSDTLTVVFDRETGLPIEAKTVRSTFLKGEILSGDIVTITRMAS